jgi:hypothetical protein
MNWVRFGLVGLIDFNTTFYRHQLTFSTAIGLGASRGGATVVIFEIFWSLWLFIAFALKKYRRAMLRIVSLLLLFSCPYATESTIFSHPTVQVQNDDASGYNVEGKYGKHTAVFHGIPYAAPPTDDLRFKSPERPTLIAGTLKAHEVSCEREFWRVVDLPQLTSTSLSFTAQVHVPSILLHEEYPPW